jgi:hypothetical protein
MRMTADVVGALAGPASSTKHLHQSSTLILMTDGRHDADTANEKLADFIDTKEERYAEFDRLYECAAVVVAAGWNPVVALANELLQKLRLDAVEAAAIIETEGGAELLHLPDELRRGNRRSEDSLPKSFATSEHNRAR